MNRLIVAILLGGALAAAPETAPTAQAILDRYVEVTGGKAAYDKIHNEVIKGTLEVTNRGMKGSITIYHAEPNSEYSVADIEGAGKVETGSDGEIAWERTSVAGPRIKTGAERDEAMRAAAFNGHVHWRELYDGAELAGAESIEGEDCYKIVLTPKDGRTLSEYYSKKTGLLVKNSGVHSTQMGELPAEGFARNYRPVSGVTVPFLKIARFAGQEIQVRIETIQFNQEIPKDRFALPDDIKALLRKNGDKNGGK